MFVFVRSLGLLLRALPAAAFAIALLAPLAWNTLAGDVHAQLPGSLVAAWAVLLVTAIVLAVLYFAWRVLLRFWRKPLGGWASFGRTPATRLIALGLVALAAPRAVSSLLAAPVNLLIELTAQLPFQLGRFSAFVSTIPNDEPRLLELVIRFSVGAQELLSELARSVGNFVRGLDIAEAILVLAAWILAGSIVDACLDQGEDGAPAGGTAARLARYLRAMDSRRRYGLLLSGFFLVGAYFCVAAIVAIPWLQEDQVSPAVTRESLENLLEQSLPQELLQAQAQATSSPASEDPLAGVRAMLGADPAQTSPSLRLILSSAVERAAQFRAAALLREAQFPAEIASRQERIRKNALVAFQVETVGYMTSQERGYFMRDITHITSQQYEDLRQSLRLCRSRVADGNAQLASWGQVVRNAMPHLRPVSSQAGGLLPQDAGITVVVAQLDSVAETFRDACITPRDPSAVYTPPEPGQGWGPFGALARWLLQTRSIALTLITGMLGFGLLGSAIATFVRARAALPAQPSVAAEISRVAIRGVYAAIVIFLAAKGGLSILANGESEPNPYVLFFGCLVGAVFSEDVWVWARGRFLVGLNGEEEGTTDRDGTAAAVIAAAAEPSSGMGQG